MRRYLLLTPLLLFAAPASAQIWGGPSMAGPSGGSMAHDLAASARINGDSETRKIRDDIRNGRESGQLSRQEARQLKREAFQIDALEDRFGRDGLSASEAAELANRRAALRADVIAKRSGRR